MSDSVYGHIVYGVVLQDDYGQPSETPWEKEGLDETTWWLKITGYQPSFKIYDETGNWPNGQEPEREVIDRYYAERRSWLDSHPMPFETATFGSERIVYYVLTIPNSGRICGRWEPAQFDPAELTVAPQAVAALKEFCVTHGITAEPAWHLGCFAP